MLPSGSVYRTLFCIQSFFLQPKSFLRAEDFLCCIQCIKTLLLSYINKQSKNFHCKGGGSLWLRTSQKPTTHLKLANYKKESIILFWTELLTDQESRWYSTFKRLNQNFIRIRIPLVLRGPSPGFSTGWTGKLRSQTNILKWQN